MQACRALGLDAVLMCSQGQYFQGEKKPLHSISVRLVSTGSGKTLYVLTIVGHPGVFSNGKVVKKLLKQLSREVPCPVFERPG